MQCMKMKENLHSIEHSNSTSRNISESNHSKYEEIMFMEHYIKHFKNITIKLTNNLNPNLKNVKQVMLHSLNGQSSH